MQCSQCLSLKSSWQPHELDTKVWEGSVQDPADVWSPFRIRSASAQGPFGLRSGSVGDPFGIRLGSVRGPYGVRTGSARGPFGVRSGSVRGPFGVRSGSVRDPFGVRSESVRAPKRKTPIYYWSQSSARSRNLRNFEHRREKIEISNRSGTDSEWTLTQTGKV